MSDEVGNVNTLTHISTRGKEELWMIVFYTRNFQTSRFLLAQ